MVGIIAGEYVYHSCILLIGVVGECVVSNVDSLSGTIVVCQNVDHSAIIFSVVESGDVVASVVCDGECQVSDRIQIHGTSNCLGIVTAIGKSATSDGNVDGRYVSDIDEVSDTTSIQSQIHNRKSLFSIGIQL